VSIKTRVRTTPESFMADTEVKHQRHRTRRICEVTGQLDVPTSLTSAPSHLLRFHFVCCAKKVSKLINIPVVRFLGTRVGGTSAEPRVVPQGVNLKLASTTGRER
jgi:hypothetical protein